MKLTRFTLSVFEILTQEGAFLFLSANNLMVPNEFTKVISQITRRLITL